MRKLASSQTNKLHKIFGDSYEMNFEAGFSSHSAAVVSSAYIHVTKIVVRSSANRFLEKSVSLTRTSKVQIRLANGFVCSAWGYHNIRRRYIKNTSTILFV